MNFYKGDMVMHWSHGIGQIVNLEERALSGEKAVYYVVQVRDMTVWVPADNKVGSRLRPPTPKFRFQRLLAILSSPTEKLPEDRLERKTRHMLTLALLAALGHEAAAAVQPEHDALGHEPVDLAAHRHSREAVTVGQQPLRGKRCARS